MTDERTYSATAMAVAYDCGYRAGLEEGSQEERKRIMEWLRSGAGWAEPYPEEVEHWYPSVADDIEAGEHLK